MLKTQVLSVILVGAMVAAGCQQAKENPRTTGTVAGGATGAAAGALIGGSEHRAGGAVIGGLVGAGAGYLIGAQVAKNNEQHKEEAQKAVDKSQTDPAQIRDVRNSTTADLNRDGFVTLDEVIALQKAGLSDQEMINRLRATGQIFALTLDQQQILRNNGVDQRVIDEMLTMNRTNEAQPAGARQRISSEPEYPAK